MSGKIVVTLDVTSLSRFQDFYDLLVSDDFTEYFGYVTSDRNLASLHDCGEGQFGVSFVDFPLLIGHLFSHALPHALFAMSRITPAPTTAKKQIPHSVYMVFTVQNTQPCFRHVSTQVAMQLKTIEILRSIHTQIMISLAVILIISNDKLG